MKNIALMYHDVYLISPEESGFVSKSANRYKMSVSSFREHLQLIKEVAPNTVLTFDDGGVTFLTVIAPLIEEYGFRGHFYIATDYIGTAGFLSEAQIKDLDKRGHYIGAHSGSHPQKMTDLTIEERKSEWARSIAKLSQITGKAVEEVSIPNGYYQKSDLSLLSDLGVKQIYTSSIVDNKKFKEARVLGRIAMFDNTTVSILKGVLSSRLVYMKLLSKQYILTLVKSLLGDYYIKIKRSIRNNIG